MGGNGKLRRWKICIHRSSSSSISTPVKSEIKDPPKEFICPVSGSLMFDPVVVYSGQTFERTSVQVCQDLGFLPSLPDGSKPDFSYVIPNLALKSTIVNWCASNGSELPQSAPNYSSIEATVRALMPSSSSGDVKVEEEAQVEVEVEDSVIGDSDRDLLRGVAETPPQVTFARAATELNPQRHHDFCSWSSEESVIANIPATPFLPFTTRPLCYSPPSSTSTSSDFISDDALNPNSSPEEQEFVVKLKSLEVFEQEQGVISLRKVTRTNEEARVSLCTPRLLSALRSCLISRYTAVQTNAAAALVNISLEKVNKVKIVRSGIIPPLIDVLKGGFPESQEHAAGAIFSLALEDDNKTAIGVLGALQPLLHALRSESERTRHDSALALYHLSLIQSNRVKLIKLSAVSTLLGMLKSSLAGRVLLVLCNLAACVEGKSAMLDSNAVECLVGMLRKRNESNTTESTRENCVACLFSLSQGSMRFKGLAREAGAAEVLRETEESGTERAREKARRMLEMLRERGEEEDEVDWEGLLEGGVSRTRYRVARNVAGANSTEF